ncbi:MAG: FeoC-like transcriptional regulator [Pseudomonadota bacterium]
MADVIYVKPAVEVINEKSVLSLSDLKQWLKRKQQTTMQELRWRYDEEPSVIHAMLQHFIRRGQLEETTVTPKCGSKCQQCNPLEVLKFKWKI